MSRIKELDGLRAIAISGVLLAHFTPSYHHFSDFLRLGWTGVDLFFAISGFLITNILLSLRGHERPFRSFYGRRTLRIFPPYYLALMLIVILALLHQEHNLYSPSVRCLLFLSSLKPGLIKLAIRRLLFNSGLPLLTSDSVPHHYVLQFKDCLGVYWSLSVEEIFYLVWAPLILMSKPRMMVIGSVAPLLVCPVLRGLVHTPNLDEVVGVAFRFDSLAAGGCVALSFWAAKRGYLQQRLLDRWLVGTIVLSSLALFLLSGYCGVFRGLDIRTNLSFSIFGFTLLAILCASVVGACVRWSGDAFVVLRVLRSKVAVYLGTISYMIYLIHLPSYVWIQLLILKNLGKSNWVAADNGMLLVCGVLAAFCTVALAAVSWKYFETPVLRLKERKYPDLPSRRAVMRQIEFAGS